MATPKNPLIQSNLKIETMRYEVANWHHGKTVRIWKWRS